MVLSVFIESSIQQYSAVFGRYSREMIEKLLLDIEDGQAREFPKNCVTAYNPLTGE